MPTQVSNNADMIGVGRTALVAENSIALALLARTLLTRWGFAVTGMCCDRTALQAIETTRFDLVVVGATGADAALIVATCAEGPPVLALTSENHGLDGATVSLRLPVDATSLREGVERCLNSVTGSLDIGAIEALWGSTDYPIYHRIVRVFIGEVRDRVARIAALQESGDLTAIEIEAHSIKGAAGNVGAHAIRDAAMRLEAAVARRDGTAIPPLTETLRRATEAGIVALEQLLTAASGHT